MQSLLLPGALHAADRAMPESRIESARMALSEFKVTAGDNPAVAADIKYAEQHLDTAILHLKSGGKIFGGVTEAAESDIRHELGLVELSLKNGTVRLDQARSRSEAELLEKKISTVKSKLKVFDDFRAEIAVLTTKTEGCQAERKALQGRLDEAGNLREQLEALKKENARLVQQLQQASSCRDDVQQPASVTPAPLTRPQSLIILPGNSTPANSTTMAATSPAPSAGKELTATSADKQQTDGR